MLANARDLLAQAMRATPSYGVLAFNVIGLEHAEAIVEGAETEASPVVLQISQNAVRYRQGQLEPIVAACRALAQRASVPVALHLDHATTKEICERAVAAGVRSIMFDASSADYAENVQRTAAIAEWAHSVGASVEGELGIVGGKDGVETSTDGMTDPQMASQYVQDTGLDLLAVALGTEHGMTEQRVVIDVERIDALRAVVNVPLVLHGSSGVPDAALREAVRRGMTKINMATQLNVAFTRAIRSMLANDPGVTDPRVYGAAGRAAMVDVVRAKCRLVGSSGNGQ